MQIADRKILYRSPVYFTPLLGENRVDGAAIRKIVDAEYAKADIRKEDLDTGAVIITGETSRKENARAVLENLSEFAGDFVVATAGPHLESVLAAKGAGAAKFSEETGKLIPAKQFAGLADAVQPAHQTEKNQKRIPTKAKENPIKENPTNPMKESPMTSQKKKKNPRPKRTIHQKRVIHSKRTIHPKRKKNPKRRINQAKTTNQMTEE